MGRIIILLIVYVFKSYKIQWCDLSMRELWELFHNKTNLLPYVFQCFWNENTWRSLCATWVLENEEGGRYNNLDDLFWRFLSCWGMLDGGIDLVIFFVFHSVNQYWKEFLLLDFNRLLLDLLRLNLDLELYLEFNKDFLLACNLNYKFRSVSYFSLRVSLSCTLHLEKFGCLLI